VPKFRILLKQIKEMTMKKSRCTACPTLTSAIPGDGDKIKSHYTTMPRFNGIKVSLLFLTSIFNKIMN